ncbi:MAG: 2-phospho-L-lactate guanylyltransferase, partial [Natrialbaceae archaeon]
MRVVIPYTDRDPKSRLAPVLSTAERRAFARAMLGDVVDTVREAGYDPELLVPEPIDDARADLGLDDVPTTVDDRPLTPAVDAVLDRIGGGVSELGIVMADLPL